MYHAFKVDMFVEDFIGFGMGVRCMCFFYCHFDVVLCRHAYLSFLLANILER